MGQGLSIPARPAISGSLGRERTTKSPGVVKRLAGNPSALAGAIIIIGLITVAMVAPLLAPSDPNAIRLEERLLPPSREHLFGTDELGRGILSRVIYGSRLSLQVGFVAVVISLVTGSLLGLVSGYCGGWIDTVVLRFVDAMLAFPDLILALGIVAVLGPSLRNAIIAVGIGGIPIYVRVTRAQVLVIGNKEYVVAAQATGASHLRILARHILPNTVPPLLVIATLGIGGAILAGTGLSFIGVGAQPPTSEWGAMLADGRKYLHNDWWISTFPGAAIAITVLGFNLLGDGLRDVLDPRSKR